MNAALRLLGGLVVSLGTAVVTFVVSFVMIVKFAGGPHSPLIPFCFVIALIATIVAAVRWQRWAKNRY